MSRRYQLLSGVLAATVSLSLTGCGSNSNETASSAPETSTAPAASETETSTTSNVEPISAEEPGNSFSYIGTDDEAPKDETVQGTVTAIEGDTISLTIGGNANSMGTPPDMPENNGESGDNGGTPPELPDDQNAENAENTENTDATDNADPNAVPAEPDDAQAAGETGDTSSNPGTPPDQSDPSSDASSSEAKTATLVLADETVLAKNDDDGTQIEAALSDITVGDTLSITFDASGDITAVVIEAAQSGQMGAPGGMGGPGGGSSAPTSYDSVNEYTSDTTVDG